MPAGRPSKLTEDLVQAAQQHAAAGLPVALIAEKIGVHPQTCNRWLREADERPEDSLHRQFRAAIFSSDAEYCRQLLAGLKKSADDGNAWSATWLLTHHPRLRDHFSDAAADRRVERRTMASVVDAIASSGLPPEQERLLLLNLQARGLGAVPAEPSDADG